MPRRTIPVDRPTAPNAALAEQLAGELRACRESGQPLVYEQELGSQRRRVTVVWDEWDRVPMDERTWVILRAFELAEGTGYRNQIALANGLTVPEATVAGLLPYQVGTALRRDDPVTYEQCRQAMVQEGGSTLFGPDVVQLRFATEEEAEACRQRLIRRLPGSGPVWCISRDISVQDPITLED